MVKMELHTSPVRQKRPEHTASFSQSVKRHFFILYCWLYRFVNTCYMMECMNSLYYGILAVLVGDRQKLEWKTHWQSPVCRAILRRKYFMSHSKSSLTWAMSYAIFASSLFLEMQSGLFASLWGKYSEFAWYAESFICLLLGLNAIIALIFYVWSVLARPLAISPVHQKLFRISGNDPGFELKQKRQSVSEASKPERLHFSSWRSDSFEGSPSFLSVTPLNYSASSWASLTPGMDTTSSSWSFYRASSPFAQSTPKSFSNDRKSLQRLNISDHLESSSYERPIRSQKQLEEFLKHVEEEDKKLKSMSFEETKPFGSSVDNSPMSILSKCRYQRSYRMPQSEMAENDSSETYCADAILNKLKVTDKMLTKGCEKIRKWICQTILETLVSGVEDMNTTLAELGLPELQIGKVSLFALYQIAVTKSQHLPYLAGLLPYLDLHLNQEYLVRRLKDLARGGYMGDFKWNSGGSYDGKQWCDDLPTDSAIVMHVLCSYFDSHLPPEHSPEGKPFTTRFFKKTPEKITPMKDTMCIYQTSVNPPQYKVIVGEDTFALQKGRSNLFCAIVVFLHCIKTKECGMLGRVNLGPSGLNVLWVLE